MSSSGGIQGSAQLNPISQHHQIHIPNASYTNLPQPQPLNLPRQDLLDDGRREEFLQICVPLYKASMKGDWEDAKDILHKRKELVRFSINRNNETAIHVAAYRGNTLFVEKLARLMENEDLELRNSSSNTALCLAAVAGHVKVAEILLSKHKDLLDITGSQEKMPLYMAALSGKKDMVKYLYENSERMTGGLWTDESRGRVLLACVEAELFAKYFDIALQIVKDRPELAMSGGSVLAVLARKPCAFKKNYNLIEKFVFLRDGYDGLVDEGNQAMELLRIVWGHIMKLPKAKIDDMLRGAPNQIMGNKYSSRILFVSAEMGNTAFIVELLRQYPEQVLALNDNNESIFHIAVTHRYRGIYSLLHDIGSIKDSIVDLEDENGNNMLHLVGILSETVRSYQIKDSTPAPASQLLKDLAWFKNVWTILPPSLREKKNKDGLSPHELFTKNHEELVSRGLEWAKKISSELMVVAALIATISFAACITFVGGYNQDTGKPVFTENKHLNETLIANGISFIFASTSIFFFLSIISSPYNETAFFTLLIMKLVLAMTFLCESILFVIMAFQDNFILLFPKKYQPFRYVMATFSHIIAFLFFYWVLAQYWFLVTLVFNNKFVPRKGILF